MNVSEIITRENFSTPEKVEQLKKDAGLFLKKIEASQIDLLAERSDLVFSPDRLENFFRKRERNEKTGQTLQYLITFLDHIPVIAEIKNEPVNPLEQMRELIIFQVNLLLEEDVKHAIFNEINNVGSINGENVWDYQARALEKNRELNELLITGSSDTENMLFTLCLVLEHLCLFWFDVKQENLDHIRRSDIYLYKLARILQDRQRQIPEK